MLILDSNLKALNYIFYGDKSPLYDVYEKPQSKLKLNKLVNSAMVPVNGVYLCIYRQGFYWLDKDFHLDLSGTRQNINLFKTKISEEDHRLLLLPNGDILTVFTSYVDYTVRAVNKAGIRFLKRTSHRNGISEYKLSNQTILYKDDIMSQLNNGLEKNWSPFNYKNNQIYFIQSFQPFRVYKLPDSNDGNTKTTSYTNAKDVSIKFSAQSIDLISEENCEGFSSYFGTIRGGTPALMVRGQYLVFYHTYAHVGKISVI